MRLAWCALAALILGCSSPSAPQPGEAVAVAPAAKYSPEELKKRLSKEQYEVCVFKGTELPFQNKYWDHKAEGVYHCVVCDSALFDSSTKFDSGTGWPSYYDVLTKGNVKTEEDRSLGIVRTEVMCKECGSHLGHLFDDGPPPTNQRYCINSAALKFKRAKTEDGKSAEETPAKE